MIEMHVVQAKCGWQLSDAVKAMLIGIVVVRVESFSTRPSFQTRTCSHILHETNTSGEVRITAQVGSIFH